MAKKRLFKKISEVKKQATDIEDLLGTLEKDVDKYNSEKRKIARQKRLERK